MDKNDSKIVFESFFWRFAERLLAQLVAFVISVILARILEPSLYGKIALITVFTSILQVFVDGGLGVALIQKKDADDIDFSTVFYANIAFCIILYLLLYCCAPLISTFYNDNALTPYIRVLGFTILISGVKNVQQAYVAKHMLFRRFFYSTLGGTVIAGVIGIILAINGAGIWALVAQQVINLFVDTVILWITVNWRPIRAFSVTRLKELWIYGIRLLISRLIDTIYNDIRQLIIGKLYTSADLAYYNQGKKFPDLVIKNIDTSVNSVLLPAMANAQDNVNNVKTITRRAMSINLYVISPIMMGLVAVAEPLTRIILTDKWIAAVPYMRIICVVYMFYPVHTANLNAIKALGRSDIYLKLEILKKVIDAVVLIIAMNISVLAMAYSLIFTSSVSLIINGWPNRKLLDYTFYEQFKDIFSNTILAVVMGGVVAAINLMNLPDVVVLVCQVFVGVFIYIFGSKCFRLESFFYVNKTISPYIKKLKNTKDKLF